jgi:hypothetical protein
MHAVVVKVAISDRDGAVAELSDRVIPQVSGTPGFVAGYWVALPDGKGTSIAVLETQAAAEALAGEIQPPPDGPVAIESVTVGEVVASA